MTLLSLPLITVLFPVMVFAQLSSDELKSKCNSNDYKACSAYGLILTNLHKTDEAEVVFNKSCNGGFDLGCYNMGGIRIQQRRTEEAKAFYLRACKLGYQTACEGQSAEAAIKKECDNGDLAKCMHLGVVNMNKNDREAKMYSKKACDGGVNEGCHNFKVLNKKK